MEPLPRGSFPTLITPMLEKDLSIDYPALDVLLEWQLDSGSVGIFSPCQSSEMFNLTQPERIALAKRVKETVAGRAAHVAVGNFGAVGDVAAQAASINEMAPHCDVVVMVVGNIAPQSASDAVWQTNVEQLLALTPGVRLGLYECPCPYHRLLSPETLAWCVSTGRFWFHKDTCSDAPQILAKLAMIRQLRAEEAAKPAAEQRAGVVHFRFYNANAATLQMSLDAGGDGFSGISANFYPFLHAHLVSTHFAAPAPSSSGNSAASLARIQRFLSIVENTICDRYPTCAKKYLQLGLREEDVPSWDSAASSFVKSRMGSDSGLALGGMGSMSLATRSSGYAESLAASTATEVVEVPTTAPFNDEQTTKLRQLKVEALCLAQELGLRPTMPEMLPSSCAATAGSTTPTDTDAAALVCHPAAALCSEPLRVAVVGFGTFGQFLARRWVSRGQRILATSRTDYSALAADMGVEYFASAAELSAHEVDVVLVSTSIMSFESVLSKLPTSLTRGRLVVDVLSVKSHAKTTMLRLLPAEADLLCLHPMFGPESGKDGWDGLPVVYEGVRVVDHRRAARFLSLFDEEGCNMVQMSCEEHDKLAAGSQFVTHLTGRLLARLGVAPSPIATQGYRALLKLVDNTQQDSFDLFYALYSHNPASSQTLADFANAFEELRAELQGFDALAATKKEAYVTMITSDSFLPGVQALAFSLAVAYGRRPPSQSSAPPRPLVVLVSPGLSRGTLRALAALQGESELPVTVIEVTNISLKPPAAEGGGGGGGDGREAAATTAALAAGGGEDGGHAMGWVETGLTKLHVWNLTQFDTVLYIDADAIVVGYTGELFDRGDALRRASATRMAFAAAPDIHPPDRFNAGVMVVCPSQSVFQWLLARAKSGKTPSYDGGDTGFLNALFPTWFEASAAHRLPFGCNAQRTMFHATHDAAPGYWRAVSPLKIVHFCSWPKPWNTEGARKKGDLEMMWWRLFTVSKVPALAAMTDFDALFSSAS